MNNNKFILQNISVDDVKQIETPFYYYDTQLLRQTINEIKKQISKHKNFVVHYAIKANSNKEVLNIISKEGLGADCVSGGEISLALESGFLAEHIVYAGVGKDDWEIELALDRDIFCFNVESAAELSVISDIAKYKKKKVRIALRINPDLESHTHSKISTGKAENKFGISMSEIDNISELCVASPHIDLIGLHFHIGSQITDMQDFVNLCAKINSILLDFEKKGIEILNINVGGGLGISYTQPDLESIPNFEEYFDLFANHLHFNDNQKVHFELGRSVVGQCGTLFTKVLYVKKGVDKQFVIVNAGMNDLVRPAMYDSYHKIQNITSSMSLEKYDVVGPVCESSDVFARGIDLPKTKRGDILAIRSSGAYGEVMSSTYNARKQIKSYTTEQVNRNIR